MNTLGTLLRLTSYGESHGPAIGAILDGFPAGFQVDLEQINFQMRRRRPGGSLQSPRKEADEVMLESGIFEGRTTGAPLHFRIANTDARPKDYDALKEVYRPSHADYTYQAKYGLRDHRGGGRSSARVTAGWVAAGALAQQYLAKMGVEIASYVCAVGSIELTESADFFGMDQIEASPLRCPHTETSAAMEKAVLQAKEQGDSLGGQIRTVVRGVPAGWGEPVFDKLGAKLGQAVLSLNAVKGFELGGGFAMSKMKGSEVNDPFVAGNETPSTSSNFSGGIQGGISNGMDIHFKTAFKPTASISKTQQTVDKQGNKVELQTEGRHDPCVVPRAVPILDGLTALVLLDAYLLQNSRQR